MIPLLAQTVDGAAAVDAITKLDGHASEADTYVLVYLLIGAVALISGLVYSLIRMASKQVQAVTADKQSLIEDARKQATAAANHAASLASVATTVQGLADQIREVVTEMRALRGEERHRAERVSAVLSSASLKPPVDGANGGLK